MNRQPHPQFIELIAEDGCRHIVRVASIQLLSDVDVLQDTTAIVVAGRQITVPVALDEIVTSIVEASTHRK